MANGISGTKQYVVNYDIMADVSKALGPLQEFERAVNSLYNNSDKLSEKTGLPRINAEFQSLIGRIQTVKSEFNKIQPSFNLEPLRDSLRSMERMVAESAANMRRVIQSALSGSSLSPVGDSRSFLSQDKRLLDNTLNEISRVERIVKEKTKRRNAMLPPDGQNKGTMQDTMLQIYGDPRKTPEFKQLDDEIKSYKDYLKELERQRAKYLGSYNTTAKRIGMPALSGDLMTPKQWRNLKKTGSKLGVTAQQKLIEEYTAEIDKAQKHLDSLTTALHKELGRFVVDGEVDREAAINDKAVQRITSQKTKAEKDLRQWREKLSKVESDKATKEQISAQQKLRDERAKQLRAWRQAQAVSVESSTGVSSAIPKELSEKIEQIPALTEDFKKKVQLARDKWKSLGVALKAPVQIPKPAMLDVTTSDGKTLSSYFKDYDSAMKQYLSSDDMDQLVRAEELKKKIITAGGLTGGQFNKQYEQFKAYERYNDEVQRWLEKQRKFRESFKDSQVMKDLRASQSRLAEARRAKREAEALSENKPIPKPTVAQGNKGALPPILGMSPQVLEQAFTGKLTLVPDVAAAKTAVAAEKFSANVSLAPNLEELRAKLSSQTFKVTVTPQINTANGKGKGAASGGVVGALQEEINTLKKTAKAPITVGTQLDRGGLLGRAQSGYNTLQALANRHPITYKLASDGSGGFNLNQALANLTRLAQSRPVPFRMVHDGSGGFALNQALARLQAIAAARPITISLNTNIGSLQTAITKALSTGGGGAKSFPIDIKPRVGALSQSIKSALTGAGSTPRSFFIDVKARTAQLTSSINQILKGKVFNISTKLDASTLTSGVPLLERLQQVWAQLPKTGKRTYTVNLKTTGLGDIARLERVIALVNNLPPSKTKNYRVNTTVGDGGGGRNIIAPYGTRGGTSGGRVYGGRGEDMYTRARAWAYPFTGNTSFGARTPAAFDMMKGMGMMMGIGGAMGVISNSFSEAVGYQNTMETAKAILRDNYKGNHFNQDYNDMVRVIRDVAMRTKFTAPEAADAARFMAMAGLDIPAIKGSIAPIADVAAISDMDLGMIADKMTNIMTEFKITPEQMRNLADMMTKTFTSTNTDMLMLAESLQYAGPMAFASGQSLAETLAMIGIMGNSGIQASMAGTTMRMMLQNLYNPNKKQTKYMQQIGLQTRDANGNRRSLFEILSDISKLTGSSDSKDVVGNLLAGKDAESNIDTFDAASKLFRVTAAAGGASLLGNIDKVSTLIQQIQGADGNSAAVSIAKQNTVAGMWAQAKSAFTEAVVKVFEDSDMQNLLKNTLGKLIDYLKQPEFIDTIKKVFDLIVNVFDILKTVIKGWMWVYDKFGSIVNEVIKWQFILTNVGYALTPFIQLFGLFSTLGGTLRGAFGAISTTNKLATIGLAGKSAANILARTSSNTSSDAALFGGLTAQAAIARHNDAVVRYQQKQWRLQNTAYGSAAPGAFWAMAYTNPERVAMRSRAAIRAEQAAAKHLAEINKMRAVEALGLSYMFANGKAPSSIEIMREWSERQNANVRRKPELFARYERRYGHSYNSNQWGRNGRVSAYWGNLGRGMGSAFTTALTANYVSSIFGHIWSSIKGGFTKFALSLAKIAGFLLNPINLVVGALGALAVAIGVSIYNFHKQNKAWQEGIRNSGVQFREELQKALGLNTSIKDVFEGLQTINVNTATVNVNEGTLNNKASSIKDDESLHSIFQALSANLNDVSKNTFLEAYRQYVVPMRNLLPGLPDEEAFSRLFASAYNPQETTAASAIVRALQAQKGASSPLIQTAQQEALRYVSEFNKLESPLPSDYTQLTSRLNALAQQFNPATKTGLTAITPSNFQWGLSAQSPQTLEYWLGAYNTFNDFLNNTPAIKAAMAVYNFNRDFEENGGADSLKWFAEIIGSQPFSSQTYTKVQDFTFAMKDGRIDMSGTAKKLSDIGVNLKNSADVYLEWVLDIYKNIISNAEYLKTLHIDPNSIPSFESLVGYMFSQNPGGAYSRALSSYGSSRWFSPIPNIGQLNNGVDPNVNRPGYEFSQMQGKWVPSNKPVPTVNTTDAPTALNNPDRLNRGYESSYSQNAARPTQVVVNIDKLMNTDKMTIASDAEERQLAVMMEDKIEQALDILKGQIVMSLQRGDYSMG